MEKINDDTIMEVLTNIQDGDESMLFKYYPNEMYHANPKDCWDTFENELFEKSYPHCVLYWCRLVCFVKRIRKLHTKRIKNPTYCKQLPMHYQYPYHNKFFQYVGQIYL